MANPVFSKLKSSGWGQTTPAGYPTYPGYQPGVNVYQPRGNVYQQGYPPQSTMPPVQQTQWNPAAMEAAYWGPSADAVDRGRMTFDDVLVKTGISFGVLLLAALVSWLVAAMDPVITVALLLVGTVGGTIFAFVNIFSRKTRPASVLAYAAFEGVVIGTLSMVMEYVYPGVVVQAVLATVALFAVTLFLFAFGFVRNSSGLLVFTLVALGALLAYRLVDMLLVLLGVIGTSSANMHVSIFGFQVELGVLVGLGAIVIGTLCLIQDFDEVKVGIEQGAPKIYAWNCAFGIMLTVVWMYLEVLRLLARLRD